MFPNGVIYDGVEDNKPLAFRGESGANDSIVRNPPPSSRSPNVLITIPDPSSRPSLPNPHALNSSDQNPPRIPRIPTRPSQGIPYLHPREV